MCGRYTIISPEEIEKRFKTENNIDFEQPLFNVAPSFNLPIITKNSPNKVSLMKWGFVPSWAKDEKLKPINARDDTVTTSPMFRGAIKHNRCLVPSTGFYEWKI